MPNAIECIKKSPVLTDSHKFIMRIKTTLYSMPESLFPGMYQFFHKWKHHVIAKYCDSEIFKEKANQVKGHRCKSQY